MREELHLPPITEEEALRRIIKSLKGSGPSLDQVNYPNYGHELYIPNVIFQCLHEVMAKDRAIHPTGFRSYTMNPDQPRSKVFYDAVWILTQAGILRPDPPNPNANNLDINKGFTLTSQGKQRLSHITGNEPELPKLVLSKDGLIPANVPIDEAVNQSSIPTLRKDNATEGDKLGDSLASTIQDVSEEPLLNNRYKVLHILSSGGFGKTYLAEDIFLPSKRRCVIKQLTYSSGDPNAQKLILERFEREAAILEKLADSNEQIPQLYAHFSENGQFYLVQEWIRGETVSRQVALNGAFDEATVKSLLISILYVLEYVHSDKIIHRDIKPENVMLREEDHKPVLIDFGSVKEIAKTMVDPFGNPTTTILVGTPAFVPIEQATGRPVFASDIYSLGLTAIYMLTGKRPQELTDLRTGDIAWREDAKDVSAGFAAILNKAISPNFRDRFPTAREMLDALHNTLPDTLPDARVEEATPEPVGKTKSAQPSRSVSLDPSPGGSSNMPQVATQWLRDFLSPVINLVGLINKGFNEGRFVISATPTELYSQVFIYGIDFTKREEWERLLSSDVGEYFLSYYPLIEERLASFGALTAKFDSSLSDLNKSIEESPVFLKQLVDTYERMIARERIPRSQFENSALQEIAKLILGQLHLQMSNYPEVSKNNLVRFTAYSLLELKVEFPGHVLHEDHVLSNLCRDLSNELRGKDDGVSSSLEVANRSFEVIKGESATLWQQLRKDRLEIAKRYNATLE